MRKELTVDAIPTAPTKESDNDTFSEEEFQNSNTESPSVQPPALRRSTCSREQTGPWWEETGHYAQAFSAQINPTSNQMAVSPENIGSWKPGIDREHDFITRNVYWSLVERKFGMHVLRCEYVFKV